MDRLSEVYVFAADLVEYIMKYHSKYTSWEPQGILGHSQPSTRFNYRVQNAVDFCSKERPVREIYLYHRCFPTGCRPNLFITFLNSMRQSAREGTVDNPFHVIQFCNFIAQLAAVAYNQRLGESAAYTAIAVIDECIRDFIRLKCESNAEQFWREIYEAAKKMDKATQPAGMTFPNDMYSRLTSNCENLGKFLTQDMNEDHKDLFYLVRYFGMDR